jgi:hypothetical protein
MPLVVSINSLARTEGAQQSVMITAAIKMQEQITYLCSPCTYIMYFLPINLLITPDSKVDLLFQFRYEKTETEMLRG